MKRNKKPSPHPTAHPTNTCELASIIPKSQKSCPPTYTHKAETYNMLPTAFNSKPLT
jgi:hypothetical protein